MAEVNHLILQKGRVMADGFPASLTLTAGTGLVTIQALAAKSPVEYYSPYSFRSVTSM